MTLDDITVPSFYSKCPCGVVKVIVEFEKNTKTENVNGY